MLGVDSAVNMSHAKTVYEKIKSYLTENEVAFECDDSSMFISINIDEAEELEDYLTIKVNCVYSEVEVVGWLPVTIARDKLMDGALAACVMNKIYGDVKIEYDPLNGNPSLRCSRAFVNFYDDRDIEFIMSEFFIVMEKCTDVFEDISENRLSVNKYIAENFDV